MGEEGSKKQLTRLAMAVQSSEYAYFGFSMASSRQVMEVKDRSRDTRVPNPREYCLATHLRYRIGGKIISELYVPHQNL